MRKNNVDMLSGPVTKGLLIMTMPIMIMNVTQSLFNIIDMTALRFFADDTAVGAVGASGMLMALFSSALIGISAGVNVVVAKRIGMGDREREKNAIMTAVLLAIVSGIVLMLAGAVFAGKMLEMTNCPARLLGKGTVYFRIYFYGMPFLMMYYVCAAILRAKGDTKRPMYILIFGGIIKVVFTVLFISLFDMDVEGVAIATDISNFMAGAFSLWVLMGSDDTHIHLKKMRFYWDELKEMIFIGVPSGLQAGMYSLANVVIAAAVNGFGADATTGISIANQFDGLMYQVVYAPSLAALPYVAQNIGAGNMERMKKSVRRSVMITVAFGAVLGSLSAVFSAQLSSIMSSTPAVIKYSQQKMIIVSSTYFLCGINEIMSGVLKGMGKPIVPAVATFVYMGVLRFVWVYAVFPLYRNLTFLYLVWPIGWALSIITLLIVYLLAIPKISKKVLPK